MANGAVLAAALAVLVPAASAGAASIANRDDKDFKVTVIEKGAARDYLLKASESLGDICPKGCKVRLDDNEANEYVLEAAEAASIEDGALYHDGADSPPRPVEGGGAPANAPR